MEYVSLYRKYRPATFDQVIGQDHIVRTLKNQIKNGTLGHAYIFAGTRGTGKTSVAKIFAKAINCLNPQDASPCLQCENCIELSKASSFDILEIDAASNNSVDSIRDLCSKIEFPPTTGKYKVYILDEVHMLTNSAFNALLKTLEEPPAHAIFILATTEIHKVPATILSRCLRFDFRLVSNSVIADRIKFIFNDSNIKYEDSAVDLIANAGNGSVRDALSIADMCVSYCDGTITYDGVLEVLGASDPKKLQSLCESIATGNVDQALTEVATLCDLGKNIPFLASDIAKFFRNLIYIKTCANAKSIITLPESVFESMKSISGKYSVEKCMSIMKIMTSLEGELRYTSQHRILFESAIVLAALGGTPDVKLEEVQMRVSRIEKYLIDVKKNGIDISGSSSPRADANKYWYKIIEKIKAQGYSIFAINCETAEVSMVDEKYIVTLPDQNSYGFFKDKGNMDALRKAYDSIDELKKYELTIDVKLKLDENKAIPYLKEMFGNKLEIKN